MKKITKKRKLTNPPESAEEVLKELLEKLLKLLGKKIALIGEDGNKYGVLEHFINNKYGPDFATYYNKSFVIMNTYSNINNLDGWESEWGLGDKVFYFFNLQDIKKIDGLRIYLNPKVRKNPSNKNKQRKIQNTSRFKQNPKPDLNDYEYKSKWPKADLEWFCKKCGYRQEGYSGFGPTKISHHPDCPVGQREGKRASFRQNPELPTNKEDLFKLGWLIGLKETYENPRYLSRILSVEELEQIIREFRDDGFNLAIKTGSAIVKHIDTRDAFDFGKRYGKKKALVNILDRETPIKQRLEDVSGLLRTYDNHKTLPTLHVLELVF